MEALAILTMISGAISLLCLLSQDVINPGIDPGWRMVSEYAYGKHKWILTVFL